MARGLVALLIALALLWAAPAAADPDRASLLVGSYHLGAPGQFESETPGVFLTWDRQGYSVSAGFYENSYGRVSVAGLVDVPFYERGDFTASIFAGLSHYPGDGRNQRYHFGDWVPIGGVRLEQDPYFVSIMPSDGSPVDAVISFGVTFPL